MMKYTLQDRLLRRELGDISRYSNFKGVYGDREWVDNLDIVDQLGGHVGCVNALSWSTSGRLLASGSDDQHLNIHTYQRESSVAPFSLATTVATGHTANIFSVKFMPHSNDRTLVTAAGDAEVRIFDIEYDGPSSTASEGSGFAANMRGQKFRNMYKGVRYLTDGTTNARVYRSHADRVKRIVTESSPHLFLTCSEDGEVRQFDLRLPSSAYPAPRGGRGFLSHRADHDTSNVPPPLISYKQYNLDLNTISCSASQPHYIALGGAHLHCFLHDRRMMGRDIQEERGNPGRASPAQTMSSGEEEVMGQATRCVRKFAPGGRKKMRRTDNGHITACKISDANPNEMIVSWSGEHIYSFDLIQSPDASQHQQRSSKTSIIGKGIGKARESGDRKRKRAKASSLSQEGGRRSSKPRHAANGNDEASDMAFRVRYQNGQSEDITMNDVAPSLPERDLEDAREAVLTDSQMRSMRIAKSLVRIRKLIFSLDASSGSPDLDPVSHSASFTAALGHSASSLPEMDEISKTWTYPVAPLQEDVMVQSTLRANRDSSRRFVQAAGTLARALGGRLQTAGATPNPALELFHQICPAAHEGPPQSAWEVFRYDFLKAILLWLEGGKPALLDGFKRPSNKRRNDSRYPVPGDAQESAIDEIIIPYLLRCAKETDAPVPNIDASRFERNETRHIFNSETQAVLSFASAIKMPLEDLSRAIMPASSVRDGSDSTVLQDRKTAMKFWGFKVGRGLLMNAAEGVNYEFVDIAFGGLGRGKVEEDRLQEEIDPDEDEKRVEKVTLLKKSSNTTGESKETDDHDQSHDEDIYESRSHTGSSQAPESDIESEDARSDAEVVLMDDFHDEIAERMAEADAADNQDESDNEDDADSQPEDSDDGDITAEERSFMFRSASDRGKIRERVEREVPCATHTRQYSGHCNVKTVKDANFFGLQDDYVVSGSDGGHVFIWDRRTSELVNILEGDSEVVNVIQGHPYEPMLAVSGIDCSIKIFSADHHAQENAEKGINLSSPPDADVNMMDPPSLGYRRRRRNQNDPSTRNENQGLASRRRMDQNYQITSQNDVQRKGGMRDAYITRGMLAQLASRLRARQGAGADGGGGVVLVGDDGEAVPVDENCTVM